MSGGRQTRHQVTPSNPEQVGLPARPFLWTLDQISVILSVPESALLQTYMHLEGRSIGVATKHQIIARNIAPPDKKPEWRVAERELIRWMKTMGFKYYERGSNTF